MNFGKGKQNIQKNRTLTIPIGVDGIGAEEHPLADKMINPTEEKVMAIIKGEEPVKKDNEVEDLPKWKLYLNTIINLLFNKEKKNKTTRQRKIDKIKSKLFKWWIKDTTNDLKDLVSFVTIHGLLGAPVILTTLTIFGLNVPLIDYIRSSKVLLTILYIIGSGSFYYLFLDVNKVLEEIWRKKK